MAYQISQQLGKYSLGNPLGKGAESTVYKATDGTGNVFALKVLRKGKMHQDTEDLRRHFEDEVQKLQELSHQNIISLVDFGVDQEYCYIVMPYIPGGSLGDLLRQRGQPFLPSEALGYVRQAALALSYAHEHRIIHRDVKPDNMLLGDNGILLADFGIALNAETVSTLTRPSAGSNKYLAPEQARGKPEYASDQYALAVTGCRLMTGKYPEDDGREALQNMSSKIASVFIRALDPDPALRFSSIGSFALELIMAEQEEQTNTGSHIFNPTLIPLPIGSTPNLPRISAKPQWLDVPEKQMKGRNQKIKVAFVLTVAILIALGGATYLAFQNGSKVPASSQVSSASEPLCVDGQNKSREETGAPNPNLVTYPPVTVPNGCVLIVNSYQGCVNNQCWNDGAIIAFRAGLYRISLIEGAYDLVATSGGKHLFCSYASYLRSQGNVLQITQPLPEWGSC